MSQQTERDLSSLGPAEQRLALELAQMKEEYNASLNAPVEGNQELSQKQPDTSAPVKSQVPEDNPQTTEVVNDLETTPELTVEKTEPEEVVKDVEFYKKLAAEKEKESETWKMRKSQADQHLGPVQQENARLRKEKEERETALLQRIDEIESLLKQALKPGPKVELEEETIIDDYFRETYPDIAPRLEAVHRSSAQRVSRAEAEAKELKAILEKQAQDNEKRRQEFEEARAEEFRSKHYLETKRLVPDIDDFIDPNKLGAALNAWADTQPLYKQDVLKNPLKYHNSDLADVINQFKHATGMNTSKPVAKKPSLGDIANKTTNAPPVVVESNAPKLLSDKEFSNIDELIRINTKDPRKLKDLMERYTYTTKHKMQPV